MQLGHSVDDLGMNLDSEIGMVGLHEAAFPSIAQTQHRSHPHHHHLAQLQAATQVNSRHHHHHLPSHVHATAGIGNQHLHVPHRVPADPLHLASAQDLLGDGKDEDGGPRMVYKNPTNRYQFFVNAWVTNYEQDKPFSERIKSAEAIWRTSSGRFCTSKHRPSRPCAECMQAQQEVEQVLAASSGLAVRQTLASEAVAAASRKRVASDNGAQVATTKKVRSSSISSPASSQDMIMSPGLSMACGGIETALILFGRRNSLFKSKFAVDNLFFMALDTPQGHSLLSFIQLVNLYQHGYACSPQDYAAVNLSDKNMETLEKSLNEFVVSLCQAGHVYEDFIRSHIAGQSNALVRGLQDKYEEFLATIQQSTFNFVKKTKASFKSDVKKLVTAVLTSEGSIFITGRNIQSWDHASQFIVNFCSEGSYGITSHVASQSLTYDQLVQAQSLIRSFGIITLSRLMQLIGASNLIKGSHPRAYDAAAVREIGHLLLDIFPIFIVRDSSRDDLHVIDQYRIAEDNDKRSTFVGILLGGSPRLNTTIEQFVSELRTVGNNQLSSRAFLDFVGNDLLANNNQSQTSLFSVFCYVVNRFGSAFAKTGMDNGVCELQQRWFDGELSISEVAVSCLQSKGPEVSVSIDRVNIDSNHAIAQIHLLQDIAYHINDEIALWSADDFSFPLPCSGDISAFSSSSVSFSADDELQYVSVSGYLQLVPLEHGAHKLNELKVFPKALSLHSSSSLGIDAQSHANELRTIFERSKQAGGKLKPIQIVFAGNGVGWNAQSHVFALFMGRVWRDLRLNTLVIANYAAGFSDMNTINEKIWNKMTPALRALVGVPSVHNTISTVLSKLEEVWATVDKTQSASIEHLEADSFWYQDLPYIHEFFTSFNASKDEGEASPHMLQQGGMELAEEWRFFVKHIDRRFNMLVFNRCAEGKPCQHCTGLGPVTATNSWKILNANHSKFFSPAYTESSLKQNYAFKSFIEEIESGRHEKPDATLPSRHGNASKLLCTSQDSEYLVNSVSQLARHYEILYPTSSHAPFVCRHYDSTGRLCNLAYKTKAALESHKKEVGHEGSGRRSSSARKKS
jgi:hypothetical protein